MRVTEGAEVISIGLIFGTVQIEQVGEVIARGGEWGVWDVGLAK